METAAKPEQRPASLADSAAVGWLVTSLIAAMSVFVRSPAETSLALAVAFQAIVHGLSAAGLTWLVVRGLGPWILPPLRRGALGALALVVAALTLPFDLANFTFPMRALGIFGAAALVTLVATAGPEPRSRPARFTLSGAGVALALALTTYDAGNHPGSHLMGMWAASLLIARGAALRPRRTGLAPLLAALAVCTGLVTLIRAPPVDVRAEALRHPGLVLAPYAARLQHRREVAAFTESDFEVLPASTRAWFLDRRALPPVPPSPIARPDAPIVVLISIDAMRPDILERADAGERFPTLSTLAREGVLFRRAYSPASSTVPAIAAMFSGLYFSQREWTPTDFGEGREKLFLTSDHSPRVPDLLRSEGVAGFHVASTRGLWAKYGVTGDFGEEQQVVSDGRRQLQAIAKRVKKAPPPGPALLYTHVLEPHAPYKGPDELPAFERYLGEVQAIDTQLARVVRAIQESPARERVVLIVTADHGEAFGEHALWQHALSIHEEVVRVPLLVWGSEVPAHPVDEPVSLIDLGPTLLDQFGQPTPGHMMGQSLAPLIFDLDAAPLSRPIAIDSGRRMIGMVFPDGWKAVRDLRTGVVEVYDLNADPGERQNLAERSPQAQTRLNLLDRFFAAHRGARLLDDVPYRP